MKCTKALPELLTLGWDSNSNLNTAFLKCTINDIGKPEMFNVYLIFDTVPSFLHFKSYILISSLAVLWFHLHFVIYSFIAVTVRLWFVLW